MTKIDDIIVRLEALEKELAEAFDEAGADVRHTIGREKVRFTKEMRRQHRLLAKKWASYVYESGFLMILTIPVIWGALVPALLMDLTVSLYQAVCFPIYGIPKVRRGDYIVIDRHALSYLNWIEKFNCAYCGYFNGLLGYVREVAGRTEQYWCPIRHARTPKATHSRYRFFLEYGDAQGYHDRIEAVRHGFDDLRARGEGKEDTSGGRGE
uniref:Uncharacterized protein n=1 Tax=Desulfovibrio sp. U5L TaxID=596152 RepID=I2PWU7_9BACT